MTADEFEKAKDMKVAGVLDAALLQLYAVLNGLYDANEVLGRNERIETARVMIADALNEVRVECQLAQDRVRAHEQKGAA
jgi:hypothetical protein